MNFFSCFLAFDAHQVHTLNMLDWAVLCSSLVSLSQLKIANQNMSFELLKKIKHTEKTYLAAISWVSQYVIEYKAVVMYGYAC